MKHNFVILSMVILVGFSSCKDEDPPQVDTKPQPVSYEADIKEVFGNNVGRCSNAGCHAVGSPNGVTANFEGAKAMAESGRLIGALEHESGFSAMPKFRDKLPTSQINKVKKWIEDGLLEK
jgi:mono/diheme cytochrome c family protein